MGISWAYHFESTMNSFKHLRNMGCIPKSLRSCGARFYAAAIFKSGLSPRTKPRSACGIPVKQTLGQEDWWEYPWETETFSQWRKNFAPMLRKPDYNMRFIPFEIRNVWSTLMRLNVSGHLSQNLAGILCHSVDVFDARTRHFWAEPPQLLVDGCHILFISLLHQIYLGEWCFTSGGFAPPIPKKYVCRDQYKSRKEQVWLKISPWRRA